MKACFNIHADKDIRLCPYSPVYERDTLEIRAQAYNSGDAVGTAVFDFYIDDDCIGSETAEASGGTYAFAHVFLCLIGKAGKHKIKVIVNKKETADTEVVVNKSAPQAVLDGGFIMFGPPNDRKSCDTFRDSLKSLTDRDWQTYISKMNTIGQSCIIIQATHQYLNLASGELVAHYASKLHPKSDIASDDPIAAILETAEKTGQKVFLSVGNNYGYYGNMEEAEEVYNRYQSYRSFYGWYLSQELNIGNFVRDRWKILEALSEKVRRLCPVKPILISPYGGIPSDDFLEYMLHSDAFDIMMPQDSVGLKRVTLEESDVLYHKLKDVCDKKRKHLWANCESFNLTDDGFLVPRFRDGGMSGEAGFVQQMQAVRPHVEKIMNYMLSGFFTPTDFRPCVGGAKAVKQYEDYVAYRQKVMPQ